MSRLPGRRHRAELRLFSFAAGLLICLLVLFGRAYYLQVVAAADYKVRAEKQQVREVEVAPERGDIVDRTGAELAVSKRMVTISANPHLITDPARAAEGLASVLGLKQQEVMTDLLADKGFVYIARKVEPRLGTLVRLLMLKGVDVSPEDKRVYPRGVLAPQLIGFVGTDNKGLAGIEKQYDEELTGKAGVREVVRDSSGRSFQILSEQEVQPGQTVTLTIDADVQYFAEQVLLDTVKEFSAKQATAVVLSPKTGEIIAMATVPVFDTNAYGKAKEDQRRNVPVTDQYEPGSTFKIVVYAAALEEGLVTPDTVFKLAPTITVYDRTVHEAHEDVPEVRELTVTQMLAQSSNVGAVTLGMQVKKGPLVEMIERFGFTKAMGVDFPGEATGMMLPPDKWSGATIANVPIGQGISVTALQMASAYGVVANGGVLVAPHFTLDAGVPVSRRVLSTKVADQLRGMLKVAATTGKSQACAVEGFTVAGKTGTAQKINENGIGYSQEKYWASFIGMVPAESPELVVFVMVDEPQEEIYGAEVAAPAFSKIADFALKHLGIAPTASQ
jgi:cell division protein FtsI (penicillin-binding protein 3)